MKHRTTVVILTSFLVLICFAVFKYCIIGDIPMFIYRFTNPNFVEDFTLVTKERKLPKHAREMENVVTKATYPTHMFCKEEDSREECVTGEIEIHNIKYDGGSYKVSIYAPIDGDKILTPETFTDKTGSQTGEFAYSIHFTLNGKYVHFESSGP